MITPNEINSGNASLNAVTLLEVPENVIPVGVGTEAQDVCETIAYRHMKNMLRHYKKVPASSLEESAAVALLRSISEQVDELNEQKLVDSTELDMNELAIFVRIGYHKFQNKQNAINWLTLVNIYKTWYQNAAITKDWIKCDDGNKRTLARDSELAHTVLHSGIYSISATEESDSFALLREIGRVVCFSDGLVVKQFHTAKRIIAKYDMSFLLLLAGDIESNPGPMKYTDDWQKKKNQKLQAEVKMLKKKLERKQNHYVQRQLELEKRDRERKRKDASNEKRHAQGLTSFTDNLGTIAGDLAASVGPTMSMVQDLLTKFSEMTDDLRKVFGISQDYDLISILGALIGVASSVINKSLIGLMVHTIVLSRNLGITFDQIAGLVPSFVTNLFEPKDSEERVSQSLIDDMMEHATSNPEMVPVTSFLAFTVGIFTYLCSGSIPTPSRMTKHFTNIGRAAMGFRALKDMCTWCANYLSGIYYETVHGVSKSEFEFMQEYPNVEKLSAATEIIMDLQKSCIDASLKITNQILTVYRELEDYQLKASKLPSNSNKNFITSLLKRIKDQVEWAKNSPARQNTIREEPLSVYLYGQPGVGKSVLSLVLKAKIYKEWYSNNYDFEACSFTRKATNEFWDGYTGQPIIELDDFGNVKDSLNSPTKEYEEFMYMINSAAYHLHMASIAQKSDTFFKSDFVIASSNLEYPQVVHLQDPGAVFRRVHMWVEVTINPKYGKELGVTQGGAKYFMFDKEEAAKASGCTEEELPPLMTDHYRFNLYRVTHNKKTNTAEVHYGDKDLTFDELWDRIKTKKKTKTIDGLGLSNAIRELAGLEKSSVPLTEQSIMESFKKVFDEDEFIEDLAGYVEVDGVEELFYEVHDPEFIKNAVEKSIHSIFQEDSYANRKRLFKEVYDRAKNTAQSHFSQIIEKLKNAAKTVGNKFLGIADFIISFFMSAGGVVKSFLMDVPTHTVLAGFLATLVAGLGVWYSGLFRRLTSNNSKPFCKYTVSPSLSSTPCLSCRACKVIDYPSRGDMFTHFLERTRVRQVLRSLYSLGINSEHFPVIIGEAWATLHKNRSAQRVYENQPAMPQNHGFAQKVYDTQPSQAKVQPVAQKVYDNQPAQQQVTRYAQGYIECQTEMHIGARVFAQRDRVQVEQTTQVLLNNAVWIQAVDENGIACRSNGVFLVGRTMLTTAHTILNPPGMKPVKTLIIRNPYASKDTIAVPIHSCQITQLEQMDGKKLDLVLVSFPPVVPSRPKILSKFIDAGSLDLLKEGSMVFSGFYQYGEKTIVQEKYPAVFNVSTRATEYYLHSPGTCPKSEASCVCPIQISNHVEYDLETQKGMCGALLSVQNNMVHTKLIGFHVAGGSGVLALGAITTQQLLQTNLERHVAKFGIPSTYLIDGRLPYTQSWVDPSFRTTLIERGDCVNVGIAPQPSSPVKTQLQPSLIFDKVQKHITKPAALTSVAIAGKMVDPMYKGIDKVLGPQVYIEEKYLSAALNDVFQNLGPPSTGQGIVHTYEEAILGVPDDPYKRSINRTTSPGYPYNLNNKKKGKTAWLGSGEDFDLSNEELRQDVESLIDEAKRGRRGDAISLATLKDEKRPLAKVDAGKTRVFEACPQHLVIAIRQYFLDFAAHIMRNRIDNGIAVGINPYSLEWTKLANHLLQKGDNMVAGDFSNFDGSLHMQVLVRICEKINEWYGGSYEDELVRTVLWEHLCNADVLVKGEVIRQTHSQPSGNPLTVIINSLFNATVMRVAYLKLKEKQGLPILCDYNRFVSEICYGDDDVKSVHVSILHWFNQETITQALAEIGLTYTDESKTGSVVKHKSLTLTTFLKRSFVYNDGIFTAPMELENVLEISNWIRGKAKVASTIENCEQCIMELALHSEQIYSEKSARIRDACAEVGIKLKFPTWEEQQARLRYERDLFEVSPYEPLW